MGKLRLCSVIKVGSSVFHLWGEAFLILMLNILCWDINEQEISPGALGAGDDYLYFSGSWGQELPHFFSSSIQPLLFRRKPAAVAN